MFEFFTIERTLGMEWPIATFFALALIPCLIAWAAAKRRWIAGGTAIFVYATFASTILLTLQMFSESHTDHANISFAALLFIATVLVVSFALFTSAIFGLPALMIYNAWRSRKVKVLGCSEHFAPMETSALTAPVQLPPLSAWARGVIATSVLLSLGVWSATSIHPSHSFRIQDNWVLERVVESACSVIPPSRLQSYGK